MAMVNGGRTTNGKWYIDFGPFAKEVYGFFIYFKGQWNLHKISKDTSIKSLAKMRKFRKKFRDDNGLKFSVKIERILEKTNIEERDIQIYETEQEQQEAAKALVEGQDDITIDGEGVIDADELIQKIKEINPSGPI